MYLDKTFFDLNRLHELAARQESHSLQLSLESIQLLAWAQELAEYSDAWTMDWANMDGLEEIWMQHYRAKALGELLDIPSTPTPPAVPDSELKLWIESSLGLQNAYGNYPDDLEPIALIEDGRGAGYHQATDGGVSSRQAQYDAIENAIRFGGDDWYTVSNLTAAQPMIIAVVFKSDLENPTADQVLLGKGDNLKVIVKPTKELVTNAYSALKSGQYYTANTKHTAIAVLNGASSSIELDGLGASGDAGLNQWDDQNLNIGSRNSGYEPLSGWIYGISIIACSQADLADRKAILEDYYGV